MESKPSSLTRYPKTFLILQFSSQFPLPTVDKGKNYLHAITKFGDFLQ